MKTIMSLTVLLLILTLSPAHCQFQNSRKSNPIKFNLNKCQFQTSREWTKMKVGVEGGRGKYKFLYDQYPKEWKHVQDQIYIPKGNQGQDKKYPVKVRVMDEDGNQARATVVFLQKNGKIGYMDNIYPYDKKFNDQFYNSDGCTGKPRLVKSQSFYEANDNLNMKRYKNYMSKSDLNGYGQIINQLNTVSKSAGSGIDNLYTTYKQYNRNAPFNLGKFLTPEMKQEIYERADGQSDDQNQSESDVDGRFQMQRQKKTTQTAPQTQRNIIQIFTNKAGPQFSTRNSSQSSSSWSNINVYQYPKNGYVLNSDQRKNYPSYQEDYRKNSDNVFSKLPSRSKLDQIILSADLNTFVKIIQQVNKTNDLGCEEKAAYLSDFVGRIQSAMSIKNFTATQLQILKAQAQSTYSKIMDQITKIKSQSSGFSVKDLKTKLQSDLALLKQLYSQYSKFDINTSPTQQKIFQLKKNITNQKSQSQIDRQQLIRQQLSYNQADALVKKIQSQLQSLQSRKTAIQSDISSSQSFISASQSSIRNLETQIMATQLQLNITQNSIDQLKINSSKLQITVQRYRSDINKNSKKQQQLLQEQQTLSNKLSIQKSKLLTDQLQKLNEMISNLQSNLPTIQQFIDDNYYRCWNSKLEGLRVEKEGLQVIYIVSGGNFGKYLDTMYMLANGTNNVIGGIKLPTEVKLRQVNIMDSLWETTYGNPYQLLSYTNTQQYSFNDDFNCLNPSLLSTGYGTITQIGNRDIEVTINSNGQSANLKLRLGACTRIQSTGLLPQIGQVIYWRGNPGKNVGEVNAYRVSCL